MLSFRATTRRTRALAALLTGALCALSGSVRAAPPEDAGEPAEVTSGDVIAQAVEAWTAGDWAETRRLLAPLAEDLDAIEDPFARERVLRFLADATLLDTELDPGTAQQLARGYVGRLLDNDAQWEAPPGAHSDQLYAVTAALKQARKEERAAACEAELIACGATNANEKTLRERLEAKHAKLQQAYDDEMVIVTDCVALNRAVALVPFGVGHFYNRNQALGATFLSTELAFGGVGMGLMLYRIFGLNCARTAGFQPGSLVCVTDRRDHTVAVRNAEQTFGILFASSVVVDVVLAQILFKDSRIVGQTKVRRGDLDELPGEGEDELRSIDPVPVEDSAPSGAKLQIRPATTIHRGGAGLGLRMRF